MKVMIQNDSLLVVNNLDIYNVKANMKQSRACVYACTHRAYWCIHVLLNYFEVLLNKNKCSLLKTVTLKMDKIM